MEKMTQKEIINITEQLKKILQFSKIDPNKSNIEYKLFFENIQKEKIKRSEYYKIINTLIKYYDELGAFEAVEELYEIESSIIGDCSEYYIPRFDCEPENHQDFVVYVREGKWKE